MPATNMTILTTITIAILIACLGPRTSMAAPYMKATGDYQILQDDVEDCCNEEIFKEIPIIEPNEPIDNLLYIPFPEFVIRDFGIHKYVINRNIKTLMTYHTDSHLLNVIFSSINQSTTDISRLVMENRAEFDAMSKNEFVANFLDFWCAYRLIQLSEFSTNNLDILANMFKESIISNGKSEL
jgi:hypothetical protein